ncbi:hypothetical protein SAY87_013232 [Trapa incisa]|uniref:Uncharacterized protein n=1 Tax=Trapa incisa TaxID=236973 RepID=A0AAN7KB71_9MYRT|nr:hypothetical protein SAY87_013232 [Trapa incisa]
MGTVIRENSKPPSTSVSVLTTASTSITETVNGSHQFRITGYTLSKGLGIGKYRASDTFTVGGYEWAIYFYPDGKSPEDNATYASLFIALASDGTDVRALFELTLLDQSGRERHKVHSHFGRTLEGGPYTLKYRGSMWGYKRFYKRNLLETSDYLKDDCLIVHCSVGVVRSHTEGPKIYSIAVPPSTLGLYLGKMLESGKGADVTFEVNGEIFSAHKLILAARSPVFRAQLYGPMKDQNTQLIKVEDIEPHAFKLLDRYTGTDVFVETSFPCAGASLVQMLLVLSAVMQNEGFEYLKESCPSLLTELLEYVARANEHSAVICSQRMDGVLDGSDTNGRRVKPSHVPTSATNMNYPVYVFPDLTEGRPTQERKPKLSPLNFRQSLFSSPPEISALPESSSGQRF